MRTALVRLINDIAFVGKTEINQLCHKQNHKNQQIQHISKTFNRLDQTFLSPDRHLIYFQSRLYLPVGNDIIFSQLGQTLPVQGQMQTTSGTRHHLHHLLVQMPDMRPPSHSLTNHSDQFVGRQGFIISHMIDSRSHLFGQQTFHNIAQIIDRSKRRLFSKAPNGHGIPLFTTL